MTLVCEPGANYRKEFIKGRFYRCPAMIAPSNLIIVKPVYDGKTTESIQADIVPYSKYPDAFSHSAFPELRLKSDEALVVYKTKYRRVLALTGKSIDGLIRVAPVYTLKEYHSDKYNLDDLKNNKILGIIYLMKSDINAEGFISLIESFPTYTNLLEPLRLELCSEGIELLDDNLVMMYDIYSISK